MEDQSPVRSWPSFGPSRHSWASQCLPERERSSCAIVPQAFDGVWQSAVLPGRALLFALRASVRKGLLLVGQGVVRLGQALGGVITSAIRGIQGRIGARRSTRPASGARAAFAESGQNDRRIWPLLLILVTLLGFALRLFRLGFQELSPAEMDTHILDTISWPESSDFALDPILGLVIQRVWHLMVGSSEFALRSVNALAGTAAIVLSYVLARHLCLKRYVAPDEQLPYGRQCVCRMAQPRRRGRHVSPRPRRRLHDTGAAFHQDWRQPPARSKPCCLYSCCRTDFRTNCGNGFARPQPVRHLPADS